jgi:transcriptional regulator with XRE-family HTH domain
MAVRTRILDAARMRARHARIDAGAEIRRARMASGLPLRAVSGAVGRSESWLSRVERGLIESVTLDELVVAGAAAGLKVWIGTYPGERAIVDAPQLQLLRRLRARIGPAWSWQFEVPVPISRDRRAADAVIRRNGVAIMIEAYTRLADAQAQLRSVNLKLRDLGLSRMVVVVAGTHANRRALVIAAPVLASNFPLGTRATLVALAAGRDPGAHGLVVL